MRKKNITEDDLVSYLYGRKIEIEVTRSMERRIRALNRRLRVDPAEAEAQDAESDEDSLRITIMSLIDRGLDNSEDIDGVYADMRGDIHPRERRRWKIRLRRAWVELKG